MEGCNLSFLENQLDLVRKHTERVVIFIDHTNLDFAFRHGINSVDLRLDFKKLTDYLCDGRFLKQSRFYYSDFSSERDVPEQERQNWVNRGKFYTFLKHNGFYLRPSAVPLRDFDGKKREKGLDSAIIGDMTTICQNNCCDTIILVAGDADYCEVISDAQKDYAIKVEVAFFEGQTSKELLYRANKFVDLFKGKDHITRIHSDREKN